MIEPSDPLRPEKIATWQSFPAGSGVLLTRQVRNHPVYGGRVALAHRYVPRISARSYGDSNLPKCGVHIGDTYS